MLFNPDDGKTRAQIIEGVLDRMNPWYRETATEIARDRGCSIEDIVEECVTLFLADMEDPAKRAAKYAEMDRQEAPYGRDPLTKKDR